MIVNQQAGVQFLMQFFCIFQYQFLIQKQVVKNCPKFYFIELKVGYRTARELLLISLG